MNHYQNSECQNGYLHDFRIVRQLKGGLLERCQKCKLQKFFPSNVPNHIYLSFHLRQALQPYDQRFKREYPNFNYANIQR